MDCSNSTHWDPTFQKMPEIFPGRVLPIIAICSHITGLCAKIWFGRTDEKYKISQFLQCQTSSIDQCKLFPTPGLILYSPDATATRTVTIAIDVRLKGHKNFFVRSPLSIYSTTP